MTSRWKNHDCSTFSTFSFEGTLTIMEGGWVLPGGRLPHNNIPFGYYLYTVIIIAFTSLLSLSLVTSFISCEFECRFHFSLSAGSLFSSAVAVTSGGALLSGAWWLLSYMRSANGGQSKGQMSLVMVDSQSTHTFRSSMNSLRYKQSKGKSESKK